MTMNEIKEEETLERLKDIRRQADTQLDNELKQIMRLIREGREHCHDSSKEDILRLVNVALNLRSLDEGVRVAELPGILFQIDGSKSRYKMLQSIADAENFTSVSKDLDDLISSSIYDIEDDGCLDLIRAECILTWPTIKNVKPIAPSVVVQYHLTCREWLTRKEVTDAIMSFGHWPFRKKIKSLKRMWFGSQRKFVSFLELLGNNDDYDPPDNSKLMKRIDELMRPEDFKEWSRENGRV